MKKLFLLFVLVLLTFSKSFSQWSTDPNNNLIIGYGQDPHICSDSVGGCYVTYTYETTWYPQKLAVERIDKYGYKPWGTKKQILGELPEQWQAEIIEDGEGGVIVSYEDNEWIPPNYYKTRVRVQKVDSSGTFLWSSTGVRVSVSEDTSQGGQNIVSDGEGGCVVLWQNYDGQYYLNRINNLGIRVWGDSGKILFTNDPNSTSEIKSSELGFVYVRIGRIVYKLNNNCDILYRDSLEYPLGSIVPDNDGGIELSGRVWMGNIPKLIAQRKDSLGNNLWPEPYVEIADSLDINTLLNIKYNNGYFYYSWTGEKNGVDKVAQFQALRLDGTKLFTNGSLPLSNHSNIGAAQIIPSETNRTIFLWNDATVLSSTIAQTYDTLGNKIWNESGVIVSYPAIAYQTITDCRGGFITQGPIDQFTIVAQQLSRNGNLGEIITTVNTKEEEIIPTETLLYQNYPNPFNSSTIIKYQIPQEGRVRISLYNILGEKIKTLFEGERSAGNYKINFSSDELPSGNYFYSLEGNSFREVKKLTILK